nr:MAG TPA: Somatostatin/Cortistatin family [Caudoviricetes sp.]
MFLERTLAQEESGNHIGCDRHGCKSHMFFWKSFFLLEYKLNSIVTNIGGAKQSLT